MAANSLGGVRCHASQARSAEILRQQAVATKIAQRRYEKTAREIAGPAEDHENARRRWLRYVAADRGHIGSTWAPKAWRIADRSLFVLPSLWCEGKRAKSTSTSTFP